MWFKSDVMSVVETAMKQRGWKYDRANRETVVTGVSTSDGSVFISIRNDEARRTLLFLMNPATSTEAMVQAMLAGAPPFLRVHVSAGHSEAQVARICAALLHLNHESLLGNLERDESSGEVRLRIALPYRDATITPEQVNWCINIGVGSLSLAVAQIQELLGRSASAPLEEV